MSLCILLSVYSHISLNIYFYRHLVLELLISEQAMNQSSFPQRGVFLVFLSFSLTALYGDSSGLAAKCVRRAAGIRTVTGWVWGPGVRAIWTTPRLPLLGV